jgi:acetyl-CoA C-acetyltransferase
MSLDPRTPVIIGVGQYLHRAAGIDDALEPADLMVQAAQRAAADAGLGAVPGVDSIRIVGLLSWRYHNPGATLARLLGLSPRQTAVSTMGGNSPQSLVNTTCAEIQNGSLDIALLSGAEAWKTRTRARTSGVELSWSPKEGSSPEESREPDLIGSEFTMNLEQETERGIYMPVQVYPMFETAIRAASGVSPQEHLVRISEMWARFSEVAAANEYAWIREAKTAAEIRTAGPNNRMIGYPYTKYMNSNNAVDMSAALLICSVERARSLGVPEDRWVFPVSGTDCHEHQFISHRDTFSRTPAVEMGAAMALELAGTTIDEIAHLDLYSCFPSAVQLGARSLGLDPYAPDRPLTLTGGLSFAGGPWNNYVMHSIATMVSVLRSHPGDHGLIWANGGYATKHAFGVYSSTPPTGPFRKESPQAAVDALPRRELADVITAAGPATIEAYTVMHDRNGAPERAIASCLLSDGRRAWGVSDEAEVTESFLEGEWVGTTVTLTPSGGIDLN